MKMLILLQPYDIIRCKEATTTACNGRGARGDSGVTFVKKMRRYVASLLVAAVFAVTAGCGSIEYQSDTPSSELADADIEHAGDPSDISAGSAAEPAVISSVNSGTEPTPRSATDPAATSAPKQAHEPGIEPAAEPDGQLPQESLEVDVQGKTVEIPAQTIQPTEANVDPDAFFNNSVFIGDSIMTCISLYVRSRRNDETMLGDARFLTYDNGVRLIDCAGDGGPGAHYFSFRGTAMPFDQIMAEMDADKVFIMLGMNDMVHGHGIDESIERYSRVIDIIQENIPGVEVIVLLNTPKSASTWRPESHKFLGYNNEFIDTFVDALKQLCDRRGIANIDLNSPLKGPDNALPDEYCLDNYNHLTAAGSKAAVDVLYAYATRILQGN